MPIIMWENEKYQAFIVLPKVSTNCEVDDPDKPPSSSCKINNKRSKNRLGHGQAKEQIQQNCKRDKDKKLMTE